MAEGELVKAGEAKPKFYLNGFPKAGLHLIELMVMPIVNPMPDSIDPERKGAWCGSFKRGSWGREWANPELTLYRLSTIWPGRYLKGHLGYHFRFAWMLQEMGACMVFIYRDLRDVAISQAYHVLAEDDVKFVHPGKDKYRALDSFEEVIKAVIRGLDEYGGLIERWEQYTGWLDEDWILPLRFEEVIADPKKAAEQIILYSGQRTARLLKGRLGLDPEDMGNLAGLMVEAGKETQRSPTFRKGKAGGWVEYWTPGVDKAFRECGGEEWLERLGYAGTSVLPVQNSISADVEKHRFTEMGRAA